MSSRKQRVLGGGRSLGPLSFGLVSILVGLGAGLGAFVFRVLIAIIHNLCFLGRLSIHYDTMQHTPPAPWGHAVALIPAFGALVVVFLVKTFAPEARGYGVPEVVDAVYYGKSVIRPIVAAVKSVASAISIGTGGSVGREGPIVQISAAFASWLGGVTRVSRWQRATLVAAGGAAGIAATFNTPIGGVLFAVEVLLHEMSGRTLVPVVLSTATATYLGERLFGNAPAFHVPPVHTTIAAAVLPAYLVMGGVMALVSVAFIRALYGAEDAFAKYLPRGPYLRHAVGMLGVGVIMDLLMSLTGHYYVQGVGYATIADVLGGRLSNIAFLLVLFALKLLTTSLTLGSGGSGGVFSPSLFMGATMGGAFGILLRALFPGIPFDPATFVLAGMAGLVAGATGAALTAIVMILELTRDYSVVLPIILTVAVSYGVRRVLLAPSIYAMKLVRRGHCIPDALQANAPLVLRTEDLPMNSAMAIAAKADPPQLARTDAPAYFVLLDDAKVAGVIPRQWALDHPDLLRRARSAEELARTDFVVARGDTTLFELIGTMRRARAGLAVVRPAHAKRPEEVLGVVTREHLWEAMVDGMELFSD